MAGINTMDFYKYHGLGNDYLVLQPTQFKALKVDQLVSLCDRHRGIGADGILFGPHWPQGRQQPPAVSIYNPDGSQAEKSGNGLRIFSCHLWQRAWLKQKRFLIQTKAGLVEAELLAEDGTMVAINMGQAVFEPELIPIRLEQTVATKSGGYGLKLAVKLAVKLAEETVEIVAVSLGNPHCVVFCDQPSTALACRLGPQLERHACFPNCTNVQFVQVLGKHHLRLEIWERGAGYTLASGSSACAAAAAAVKLGKAQTPLTVQMPGGSLKVEVSTDYHLRQQGPVEFIYAGHLSEHYKCSLKLQ